MSSWKTSDDTVCCNLQNQDALKSKSILKDHLCYRFNKTMANDSNSSTSSSSSSYEFQP